MDELSHTLQLLARDEEFLNSQTVTLTYTVKIKNLSEDVAVKVYLYNTATGASWSKEPSEISGATYSMRGPARATALSSLFAAPLNSYDEPDVFSAASSDTYDGDKAPNVEVNLKQMHEVSYRWTGLPDGATAQLPAGLKCFEGTQVSVDATFASGMELEINGKTYVFSGWDKSDFTMPNDNIIITGTWTEKGANAPSGSTSSSSTPKTKYTVKWLDTEGNLLKSEIRGPVRVGTIVSATDEDMIYPGYVLFTNGGNDRPTAKAERNNRTELVLVFSKEQPEPLEPEFTVTVNYIFTDGTKAHPEQVVSGLKADSDYSIASPFLEGFSPDLLVVSGKIDGADVSIIVTYTAESTNKPSDETLPSDTPTEDHPENEPPISGDEPNGEDEPVQNSPSAIDSPQMDNTPRTGDNSHTHLWTGLCATSLIGIVLLLRKKSVTDK